MYGNCVNHIPYRTEEGQWVLSGDLSAWPGFSSIRMKKQIGSPRIGLSHGQLQPRPPAGLLTAQSPWILFAASLPMKTLCSQELEAEGPMPRSARGRDSMERLQAAHELLPISADSLFVNNLESQSQSTNCED